MWLCRIYRLSGSDGTTGRDVAVRYGAVAMRVLAENLVIETDFSRSSPVSHRHPCLKNPTCYLIEPHTKITYESFIASSSQLPVL